MKKLTLLLTLVFFTTFLAACASESSTVPDETEKTTASETTTQTTEAEETAEVIKPDEEAIINVELHQYMVGVSGKELDLNDEESAISYDEYIGVGVVYPSAIIDSAEENFIHVNTQQSNGFSLQVVNEYPFYDDFPDDFTEEDFEKLEKTDVIGFFAERESATEFPFENMKSSDYVVEKVYDGDTIDYYFTYLKSTDGLDAPQETLDLINNILATKDEYRENLFIFTPDEEYLDILNSDNPYAPAGYPPNFGTFTAETLTGETVSEEIFADYEITMINFWATWCGPCISEMPDLARVYENLPEGANFISVATDGATEGELALEILNSENAMFPTLIDNDEILENISRYVQAIPTTIFVDSDGNLIGEPIVGVPANAEETYLNTISERMELVK